MDHTKCVTDLIHFTFLGVRQTARQSMRLIPCVQCNHVTSHCDWWRKKISCVLVFNYLCNMAVIILHNTSYPRPNMKQIKIFFLLLHWVDLQKAVVVITSPGLNLYI